MNRENENEIQNLISKNNTYFKAAKNPLPFICSDFDSRVPLYRKNLLLIGGGAGTGKSNCVTNIVLNLLGKMNPTTGKPYRILVLTNEESPEDFYNRLTCLINGWTYVDHNKFTKDQISEFNRIISILMTEGILDVCGDNYNGLDGNTTTLEGILDILESAEDSYDLIVLDYYQNVTKSRERPNLNEYQVQKELSIKLSQIKEVISAPIVVMAQVNSFKDDDFDTPFIDRLRGAKSIFQRANFVMEMIPEYDFCRTRWRIQKSETFSNNFLNVFTGYSKGKHIQYTDNFRKLVADKVEENLENKQIDELIKARGDRK